MKWYEATKFGIEPVEVIRETDYFLILAKGGRVPKKLRLAVVSAHV